SPKLPRAAEARTVEDVLNLARSGASAAVGPDLGLPIDLAAIHGEVLDRVGLSLADHHFAGVAVRAVVLRCGDFSEMGVPGFVSGTQGSGQSGLLPPVPELGLEHLSLMRLGQLKKEVGLLGEDDRLDVVGQPPPVVVRQGLDAVGSLL